MVSVQFSDITKFTELCNLHQNPILKHFHLSSKVPVCQFGVNPCFHSAIYIEAHIASLIDNYISPVLKEFQILKRRDIDELNDR